MLAEQNHSFSLWQEMAMHHPWRCRLRFFVSRRGTTIVEVLVASVLVCVIISMVGVLSVANNRMCMQVRHMRLAADEAQNQVTALVSKSPAEIDTACKAVVPGEALLSVFPEASVSAVHESNESLDWVRVIVQWGDRASDSVEMSSPVSFAGSPEKDSSGTAVGSTKVVPALRPNASEGNEDAPST